MSGHLLQSWKEIAEYVGRTERTLQRWEREFGFPVHRPSGTARSAVVALVHEIEEWTRGKPSLLQIRGSVRLNRIKLTSLPAGAIQGIARAKGLQQNARSERMRQAALLDEQKQLRAHVHSLRDQQRVLLKLLVQTLGNKFH